MTWPVSKKRLDKGMYWERAWKLVEGCTHVSGGCDHCWSATETNMRARHPVSKISEPKCGLVQGGRFNGKINLRKDNLDIPLKNRKPTVYAVWNDLFHEKVPSSFIMDAFDTMACATVDCGKNHKHELECWKGEPHTFLILTKRPERMLEWFTEEMPDLLQYWPGDTPANIAMSADNWPLPNVWLGVSIEDQKSADERIPILLELKRLYPSLKVFISYEPALGPVDIEEYLSSVGALTCNYGEDHRSQRCDCRHVSLDWVICGGESGPGARPMHPDWARSVRDQCKEAGVDFFFKQWGEWGPHYLSAGIEYNKIALFNKQENGDKPIYIKDFEEDRQENWIEGQVDDTFMYRIGKKKAGALLDGEQYKELPK